MVMSLYGQEVVGYGLEVLCLGVKLTRVRVVMATFILKLNMT